MAHKGNDANYISEHVAYLRKDVVSQTAVNIRNTIYEHLQRFLRDTGKKYPSCTVSELLKVGSFHEETKINYPDEFDFIAVIELLSKPDACYIQRQENDGANPVLRINNNDEISKLITSGWENDSSQQTPNEQLAEVFGRRFYQTVFQIPGKQSSPAVFDKVSVTLPTINGLDMSIRFIEPKLPNLVLEFTHCDKKISVDLCPTIRFHDVGECYDPKYATFPEIGEAIVEKQSVLFVPHINGFRITFTEMEVDYMRNHVSKNHRTVYMYLKYFSGKYVKDGYLKKIAAYPFSSYMMKTVCIYHDISCKGEDIMCCLRGIIQIMERSVKDGFRGSPEIVNGVNVGYLPNMFNKRKNLYNEPYKTVDMLKALRIRMIEDLKHVHASGKDWPCLQKMLDLVDERVKKSVDEICSKTWSNAEEIFVVPP